MAAAGFNSTRECLHAATTGGRPESAASRGRGAARHPRLPPLHHLQACLTWLLRAGRCRSLGDGLLGSWAGVGL